MLVAVSSLLPTVPSGDPDDMPGVPIASGSRPLGRQGQRAGVRARARDVIGVAANGLDRNGDGIGLRVAAR
jgi:hypothetical protein